MELILVFIAAILLLSAADRNQWPKKGR